MKIGNDGNLQLMNKRLLCGPLQFDAHHLTQKISHHSSLTIHNKMQQANLYQTLDLDACEKETGLGFS